MAGEGPPGPQGTEAIRIYGYRRKKIANDAAHTGGEETTETTEAGERTVAYFLVLSVFDIGQTDPADEDHAEYVAHRGIKETEAESVACTVASILGLDATAYGIGYVAGWSDGDTEAIKATAARVLRRNPFKFSFDRAV